MTRKRPSNTSKPATDTKQNQDANSTTTPTKVGGSGPNTPVAVYLDTFSTHPDCKKDKEEIEKHCAPKPESKKKDEKTRKTGLARHIRQVMGKMDEIGKKHYGYPKGDASNNQWMEDHCDGMWVKPQFNNMEKFEEEIKSFKNDLNNLGTVIDYYLKNPGKMIEAGYTQLVREAIDKLGYENVRNMALNKFGKDLLVALLPTKAGALGKLGTAMKVGAAASGYVDMGEKLVEALGTDAAQEILQDMKFMLGDAEERFGELLKQWKENPDAVMAELMTLNAELDKCLRARKCRLTPYNANKKKNVAKGNGCCPGQTAHHIIPDSAAKEAKCTNYTYGSAPTICLEGQDNNSGSHGRAHTNLDKTIERYNGVGNPPKPIKYAEMRDQSLNAIKDSVEQCNHNCLVAQLDAYYKNCNDLIAKSGKGGPIPEEKETQTGDNE